MMRRKIRDGSAAAGIPTGMGLEEIQTVAPVGWPPASSRHGIVRSPPPRTRQRPFARSERGGEQEQRGGGERGGEEEQRGEEEKGGGRGRGRGGGGHKEPSAICAHQGEGNLG